MDSKIVGLIMSAIGVVFLIIGAIVALSSNLNIPNSNVISLSNILFSGIVASILWAVIGSVLVAFGIVIVWKSG